MENQNQNKNIMKIPEHCSGSGNEITEGYGKMELIKTIPFVIIGLIIGLILMVTCLKVLATPVLSTVIGAGAGFIFCVKDRYSRESIVDLMTSFYKFSKSQKYFDFRRKNN